MIHGSMDPWIHGSMDPGIHGSWVHGSRDPGSMDLGVPGPLDPYSDAILQGIGVLGPPPETPQGPKYDM